MLLGRGAPRKQGELVKVDGCPEVETQPVFLLKDPGASLLLTSFRATPVPLPTHTTHTLALSTTMQRTSVSVVPRCG